MNHNDTPLSDVRLNARTLNCIAKIVGRWGNSTRNHLESITLNDLMIVAQKGRLALELEENLGKVTMAQIEECLPRFGIELQP